MKRFTAYTYTGNTSAEDRTRGWDRIRFADESRRAYLDDECRRFVEHEDERRRAQARAAGRAAAAKRKAARRGKA